MKAYIHAWNCPAIPVALVVEEINRGNCAQIFGDLFQLLDRNESGFSEYPVLADTDLADYLRKKLLDLAYYTSITKDESRLMLPPNLSLYATMNTSDQSLFPMDSAFKRRWEWEYVPIDYAPKDRQGNPLQFVIHLSDQAQFAWGEFIRKVNERIYQATQSEDKQLGYFFVKPADGKTITLDTFKSKVMFYLWYEVFRYESEDRSIFKYTPSSGDQLKSFRYSQLFDAEGDTILLSFLAHLGIPNLVPAS